ncbi:hypothetical protein H4R34_001256 [Dimargaris verticillata]|uniref:Peptide hydrolase n=1 Tax=Dimargaris verticillata TaxID=2761393 RepID=A0A9W8EEM8_9FUNG|nr:hypothetical protein H4R34_001256 [Dimargaris verticillata]
MTVATSDLITTLTDDEILQLANLTQIERLEPTGEFLKPFLVKRVPGTEGNKQVQQYIIETMTKLGWFIETDPFTADTPLGRIDFRNIIATKNPKAPTRLMLSAHFDSKYFAPGKGDFIGATDSAVPCALLLDIAHTLDKLIDEWHNPYVTVQLVFFDGEEAFKGQVPEDFIWGAKHLASYWEQPQLFAFPGSGQDKPPLQKIDLMVLLDLIGTPQPLFHDYFDITSDYFKAMAGLERRLRKMFLLTSSQTYFNTKTKYQGRMIDDHVPFVERDVPVLHLIPWPFPDVWHTVRDDASCLDMATIHNFSVLMRVFVASYLKAHPSPLGSAQNISPRFR